MGDLTMLESAIDILISLPAVFLAISIHEFAHAWTAVKLGDDTPRNHGRLTMDPLVHVDWVGLFLFVLFGYGWARPVQVNPSNFRSKNKKLGDILVALAGPISNFMLAITAAFIHTLLAALGPSNTAMDTILLVIDKVIQLNISFGLLNLLPIPPLDGYRVIKSLFFRSSIKIFMLYEQYSVYILAALILLDGVHFLVHFPAEILYSKVKAGMDLLAIFLTTR